MFTFSNSPKFNVRFDSLSNLLVSLVNSLSDAKNFEISIHPSRMFSCLLSSCLLVVVVV